MSFYEWLFSAYENPRINGEWGPLHISVLVACVLLIVTISLYFSGSRADLIKQKRTVLWIMAGVILFFGVVRRVIGILTMENFELTLFLRIVLPRPWCAISCWMVIVAMVVNKKFFYNFTAITSILCTMVFFAYPGAGFIHKYVLFDDLYSIVTHALLLVSAVLFITLKFTDFKFNTMWKELICLGSVYIYGAIETWILKIEKDPLYYLPGNDIVELFNMDYGLFIVLYILFVAVFWTSFYVVQERKTIFKSKKNSEI